MWEGKEFYSLWRFVPMKAIVNTKMKKPHFAYKKGGGGNENSGTGESIEHELAKKEIYNRKSLLLKIGDIEDTLIFSEISIEKPFENRLYQVDLYAKIKEDNKFEFPIDSFLIIEIHKTHKVSKTKQQFFRDKNYAAVEIKLYKTIKYKDNLEDLQEHLVNFFNKPTFGKFLHDPLYKKHSLERKSREEKLQIQSANSNISKTNEYFLRVPKTEELIKKDNIEKTPNIFYRLLNLFRRRKNIP